MIILTVAVVLIGVVLVLDLMITLGLVRRLRSHAEMLTKLVNTSNQGLDVGIVAVGTPIASFTATALDGLEVAPAGGTVLGFFSTRCDTCAESLPGFLAYAEPLGKERVIAIVNGDEPMLTEMAEKLSKVARVVIEAHDGPVARAVGVVGTPTLVVLDDNLRVAASGYQAGQLTA
ncbi:TlpA family protein disulfide reductase [Kribbella deserti]|uniref:TlpA family protein disulfide reductase n=1 Tax=Kribbella deserti TaxID=1926257 RepID=A0ABV6QTX4_9ACTN